MTHTLISAGSQNFMKSKTTHPILHLVFAGSVYFISSIHPQKGHRALPGSKHYPCSKQGMGLWQSLIEASWNQCLLTTAMLPVSNPAPQAGTALALQPLRKLDQLSHLAEFWVLLEFFGQSCHVFFLPA